MPIKFAPRSGNSRVQLWQLSLSVCQPHETGFYDGHIPPEMVKNRLVVVLKGKINGNACIIVPLSTTRDSNKIERDCTSKLRVNSSKI